MANTAKDDCAKSVKRIQDFDAQTLIRKEDLGELSFNDAIEPAKKLIEFFKFIPIELLHEIPQSRLEQIRNSADHVFNTFDAILKFSARHNSPTERDNLIETLNNIHESIFNELNHAVSYLASKKIDFNTLTQEAIAASRAIEVVRKDLEARLTKSTEDAETILSNIRSAASEQGVSQKAMYFKIESKLHAIESKKWRNYTIGVAIGLGFFAIASIFIHKIPFLSPKNIYESFQLTISKALIAASILYMLFLCARNFLSHKHNEILNKHRQNALLTFNALVDATKDEAKRDIILQSAASCIFSPQDTGYSKHGASGDGGTVKLIEIAPKMSGGGS